MSLLHTHSGAGLAKRMTIIELPDGLTTHSAWIQDTFPADHHADPERQQEARAGLCARISGLSDLLDEAAAAVRAANAVVLRGVPAINESMLVALASAVGPVVVARPDLPLVDDLAPKGDSDESTRSGDRRDALNPHTDNSTAVTPPEVLVLAFVHNSDPAGGGESTLVHVDDVAESMVDSKDLDLLQESVFPSLNVPTDLGLTPTVTSVLYRRPDGTLGARYRDAALDAGIASDLALATPTAVHLEALRRFTARVLDPGIHTRVRLDTGDMLIIDNSRFLHGRTEISANAPRHLKRLYTRRSWS